jgi:multiple sugar transport system substrate-binding protein
MKSRMHFLIALLLVLASLLAACGDNTNTSGPSTAATTAPGAATTAPGATTAAATTAPGGTATTATAATTAAGATTAAAAGASSGSGGKVKITMWTHSAGNKGEMEVLGKEVPGFNSSQSKYEVTIESFPQSSYNDSVAAASVAGNLPCIMDMDGPTVPNFAWSNFIQPLPITDADITSMGVLNSAVGRYNSKIYSLGQFDVALLIYGRKSILDKNSIRIPSIDKPWTLDEFNAALAKLKTAGGFEYPIDLGSQGTGEWWPYAYSPMLESFGGDLIDRKTYSTAEKALNGPEAVKWGTWFQGLFKQGYAAPKPADDQAFLQGRVALAYNGSWATSDVVKKYGDDALLLPPPDFGTGPKIGGASWQWGISAKCQQAEGAWQFIKYIMQPENVALYSKTNSLIPTTAAGAALVPDYAPGGKYRIYFDMASKYAVLRPPTPGYLIISSQFEKAGLAIRDGNNVQNTLDDAVDAINRDLKDHNNYAPKS